MRLSTVTLVPVVAAEHLHYTETHPQILPAVAFPGFSSEAGPPTLSCGFERRRSRRTNWGSNPLTCRVLTIRRRDGFCALVYPQWVNYDWPMFRLMRLPEVGRLPIPSLGAAGIL